MTGSAKRALAAALLLAWPFLAASPARAQEQWDQQKGNCDTWFRTFAAAGLNDLKTCLSLWEAYRDVSALKEAERQSMARVFERVYREGDPEGRYLARNAMARLGYPPPAEDPGKVAAKGPADPKGARKRYRPHAPEPADQKAAAEHIKDLLLATNSEAVWTAGALQMTLNIVPYGDTSVGSFVPNTTPLYNLGYDDFLGVVDSNGQPTGDNPVSVSRTAIADVYNVIPVEWWDRMAAYNVSTVQDPEPVDVALHGTKVGSGVSLHMITRRAHALALSRILAQRSVYLRNQYTFKVGWKYMLLEPMDLVTLTDPKLGLNMLVVRIISVDFPEKASEDEGITIVAEAWPFGVGTPVVYQTQPTSQATPNLNLVQTSQDLDTSGTSRSNSVQSSGW